MNWVQRPARIGIPICFHLLKEDEVVGVIHSSSHPDGGYIAWLKGQQIEPFPPELPHGFWRNVEDAKASILELAGRCS